MINWLIEYVINGLFEDMKIYSFEKLEVWQNSRVLVTAIYQLTKKFPQEERFGLTNQLRRASVSVSSNIAEGNSER